MDNYFVRDIYKAEDKLYLGLNNEDFNSEREVIGFINNRFDKEKIGVLCQNQVYLDILKLVFMNFGFSVVFNYDELEIGKIFLGLAPCDYPFDSIVLYLIDDPFVYFKNAKYQKFVVTNKELSINPDEYKIPQTIDSVYLLYKRGMLGYAKDFATRLFRDNAAEMGRIFDNAKYYTDMVFMGMMSLIPTFSFTRVYEIFRLEKCRDEVLKFIGINFKRFFDEVNETKKYYLVETILFDYNKEMILKYVLENNLRVFESLPEDLKFRLYVVSDRSVETIKKGVSLGIWSNMSLYRYGITELDYFDFDNLVREVEYSCDKKMIMKLLTDFDNKRILDIAVQIHSKNYSSLPDYVKTTIYLNVFDSLESLRNGYILGIWNYEDCYDYALSYDQTKEYCLKFLQNDFETFAYKVSKHKNKNQATNIINDFPLELIEEKGVGILKYLDVEKRHELFLESVNDENRFMRYYDASVWKHSQLFRWYLENHDLWIVRKVLNKDLVLLIQDINRVKDDSLFLELFNVFDHNRILSIAGSCSAGYLFKNMDNKQREQLMLEVIRELDPLESGIRLSVWNSVSVYRYGISNSSYHDIICRALSRNLDILCRDVMEARAYDLMDYMIKDFEIIDIFDESYCHQRNIFVKASINSKEEIIKAIFHNNRYLEWMLQSKEFTPNYIYDICLKNSLDCSVFYKRHIEEILDKAEPNEFLGQIVLKTKTYDQSIVEISKHFRKGKGKKLKEIIEKIKKSGPTFDLILKGLTKRASFDMTKDEMLEMLKLA